MSVNDPRNREDRARQAVKRRGLVLRKSRGSTPNAIDFPPGKFLVIDPRTSNVIVGERGGVTLDGIERWLAEASA